MFDIGDDVEKEARREIVGAGEDVGVEEGTHFFLAFSVRFAHKRSKGLFGYFEEIVAREVAFDVGD